MDTLTDIISDKYINVLRVIGDYNGLVKFFDDGFNSDRTNQFTFKKFIPDNVSTNDYEKLVWCINNYGVITDCFETNVDDYKTNWLGISFQTCGGAPIKFVEQLSKMYPNEKFELLYSSKKLMDNGMVAFKSGEITYQKYCYDDTEPNNSLWYEYYDKRIAEEKLLKQIEEELNLTEELKLTNANTNHADNQK